ncbi:hypothetical protein NDU88_000971 [Pleurodeles waltl]|uniref:Uncharacterized protein n=1 Tax=Pleurodeles waltl TaxID=8319 RepID=A0AAV7WH04_PLEWA|nr:hypothetical protein NDU88_000971 [Pleurodeles waltl]
MIWAYRTTRNNVTGEVPFELMRRRKAGTRELPAWMRTVLDNCVLAGKEGVENEDVRRKCNKNNNGGARVRNLSRIQKGDWVKVRAKVGMWQKFRGPFKVKEVHRFFVVLENGEKWNLRKVAKYCDANSELVGEKNGFANVQSSSEYGCSSYMLMDDDVLIHSKVDGGVEGGHTSQLEGNFTSLRRTQRNHRTPAYLGDYVR